MAIIPFRGLSERGILKDPSPYDLPMNAWSGGQNVIFRGGKAQRAPAFREVLASLASLPAFVAALPSATGGFDRVVFVGEDGRAWTWLSGAVDEITPAGFTPAPVATQFTSGFLGDVWYLNNPAKGLYFLGPAATDLALDPQWDPTWKARVFRVYKDYPVALGLTKGAVSHPTMVKTGSNTLAGLTTSTWDHTDTTNNAVETVLPQLTSGILDAATLGDSLLIYSLEQVVEMVAVSSVDVFQFRTLDGLSGTMGTNCVASDGRRHFVFGRNDIYTHDGTDRQSIVGGMNKEFIFRNLNYAQADRCFTRAFPGLNVVVFGYVSSDPDVVFKTPHRGCNKAFVWNYESGEHGFVDLPCVTFMDVANLNTIMTFATTGALTFDTVGGTFADQDDSRGRVPVAVSALSAASADHRLLAFDYLDKGRVAFPYVAALNPPSYLERIGLDLDEAGAPLSSVKVVGRLLPQVTTYRDVPVQVQVGSSMSPAGPVVWSDPVTFDPKTQYKVDFRRSGRYLAARFSVPSPADFEVHGFDLDVDDNGDV